MRHSCSKSVKAAGGRLGIFMLLIGLAASAQARDPILFVHGWNSSGSTWNTMVNRFRGDGWPSSQLYAVTYNTSQSNATTAAQLRDTINSIRASTGAAKVDVIAHSMGSLSTRYMLKFLGSTGTVDSWVSLGGPNHGTNVAWFCFSSACSEMRSGSSFLANLNAGDETPGGVRYATYRSPCDIVINPDSSVRLSGATNYRTWCMSHGSLTTSSGVYRSVRDWVD